MIGWKNTLRNACKKIMVPFEPHTLQFSMFDVILIDNRYYIKCFKREFISNGRKVVVHCGWTITENFLKPIDLSFLLTKLFSDLNKNFCRESLEVRVTFTDGNTSKSDCNTCKIRGA